MKYSTCQDSMDLCKVWMAVHKRMVCVTFCWPDPQGLQQNLSAAIPRNTVALAVKCCKLQILAHIQKYKYVWLMFMLSPLAEDNSAQFWGHTSQNTRAQTTQPLYAFLLSPSISPANNQRPYGKHTPMVHWLLWLLLKEWAVAWFRGVSGASLKGKII